MLVGFHGKLGSGKDAAAARLSLLITDYDYQRRAFADPLKESAAAALGVTREDLESRKNDPDSVVALISRVPYPGDKESPYHEPVNEVTVREYLQLYGTESHRDIFGQDFWVDATLAPDFDHSGWLIAVTDVRFPNERDRIHDLGGKVVHILGPNEGGSTHASEQVLEDCDWVIDNSARNDDYANLDNQLRMFIASTYGFSYLPATSSGLAI